MQHVCRESHLVIGWLFSARLLWENQFKYGSPWCQHANLQKEKWSCQGYLVYTFLLASLQYAWEAKESDIDTVWHNFPPDRSLLTINHPDGPFIKWPRLSSPPVTHKRFSNLKSDIDGALRPAAASLSLAGAEILIHMLTHSLWP